VCLRRRDVIIVMTSPTDCVLSVTPTAATPTALVDTTGAALAANPRPLQTHLSCPACIASGNFIREFPSINSWSRLFSRWRMHARSVEQMTSLARACVNVRIGEFMIGNSRTKLPMQCMLGRRGQFEEVAICNAERCQPCI